MTAFLALLHRDLTVAARQAPFLLLATLTQPILVILVFGNLLPRLGLVSATLGIVMVPGLMAISILMAGVQGVLMPLVQDFSGTREVDERLLAPISVLGVTVGRIVAGAVHAATAGLVAGPVMILLMHGTGLGDVQPRWALLLPFIAICGLLSASFGLTLGTHVQPRFAGLLFAVVLGPMMLFGCAYYPWGHPQLKAIGSVRYLFLLNPLTFVSEAMRLAVTPEAPHMPTSLLLAGLLGWLLVFTLLGTRSFEKRAIL
jgi:ABC-2 type transport system permease protein